MTCHRPGQGRGVMKISMLHSHTKLQRTVYVHTKMYIKCTHYTQLYTLLYKVSPPPPWRWPGEQRGGEGGRVVCAKATHLLNPSTMHPSIYYNYNNTFLKYFS